MVALTVGHRVQGVRLHSTRAGVTNVLGDQGRAHNAAVAFAGYPAPSVLGLAFAALLATHQNPLVPLLLGLILTFGLLLLIRNLFGAVVVVAAGGVFAAVAWWAGPQTQTAGVYVLTWFLLFGSVRGVLDLHRARRSSRSSGSDADHLRALTRVPGIIWELVFAAIALGAVALAARWLLS